MKRLILDLIASLVLQYVFPACATRIPLSDPTSELPQGLRFGSNALNSTLLQNHRPWPPDNEWPFTRTLPRFWTSLGGGVRVIFSYPAPIPVTDLSAIGNEVLEAFMHLPYTEISSHRIYFPVGPFPNPYDGPFVHLDFSPIYVSGIRAEDIATQLQRVWWAAQDHFPTRSMRMVAEVDMGGYWVPCAELKLSLSTTPPEEIPNPNLPFPFTIVLHVPHRNARITTRAHHSGRPHKRRPYARMALLKLLTEEIDKISRAPPSVHLRETLTTAYLNWEIRKRIVGYKFKSDVLLAVLIALHGIISQHGAWEMYHEIWKMGTTDRNLLGSCGLWSKSLP